MQIVPLPKKKAPVRALPAVVAVQAKPQPKKVKRKRNARPRLPRAPANEYLATLADPENRRGVKIPDAITLPSGTYSFTSDFTATADGSGRFVAFFQPASLSNSGSTSTVFPAIYGGNTTAGYGNNLGQPIAPLVSNPSNSAYAARLRVVSAVLSGYCTSSPLNIQGVACSFMIPINTALVTPASTFGDFTALAYNTTNHAINGGTTRYLPSDPSEHNYVAVRTDNAPGYALSSGSFLSSSLGSIIGIAFSGLTAGASLRFRAVANLEIIPANDLTSVVDVTPSYSDTGMLNQVASYFSGANMARLFQAAVDSPTMAALGRRSIDYAQRYASSQINRALMYGSRNRALDLI